MSQSRARIRKLPVHDHMTHMVKTDILTGHKEKGNLHFILKIIFHCIFIGKPYIFSSLELAQSELLGYRDVRRKCGRP